jgi:hypothetical protein
MAVKIREKNGKGSSSDRELELADVFSVGHKDVERNKGEGSSAAHEIDEDRAAVLIELHDLTVENGVSAFTSSDMMDSRSGKLRQRLPLRETSDVPPPFTYASERQPSHLRKPSCFVYGQSSMRRSSGFPLRGA